MSGTGFGRARMLHAALTAGPTILAVAAVFARGGEPPAELNPDERRLIFYIWMAAVVGAVLGAMNIWRARVVPRIENGGAGLLAALVLAWALVEAAAILGVVMYFLTGSLTLLIGSLAVIGLHAAIARPRRDWFRGAPQEG